MAPGQAALLDRLANLVRHRQADRIVEVALAILQHDALDDLALRRQFGRDLRLGPAQQKRFDPPGQRRRAFLVGALLDREAPKAGERGLVAEIAGIGEAHDRPEFAQMIFHRRSRQAEAMPRLDVAQPAGCRRIGILDRLRFVQHRHVPIARQQDLAITRDQGIRGQHHIMRGNRRKILLAAGTVEDEHLQIRRKFPCLVEPIGHQAGRRDDQRRLREIAARLLQRQQRQNLYGLAEPHIVGEHPAQAALAKQIEPGHALRLVRPELGAKAFRQRHMAQASKRGRGPRDDEDCRRRGIRISRSPAPAAARRRHATA